MKDDFSFFAEYYDQVYQRRKDYRNESKIVREIIRKFENIQSKTLLDVGCGTGEHLKHLSLEYECTGVDINRRMIEVARKKVLEAQFKVANMIDFRLKDKFDVVICLFSSIGYVQSFSNLVKTFETFYRHLHDKGLVIVEPWVFKKDYKKAKI
ncbi:methyltransferase domain-containing protein, partial [Candidatus Bathyarchaeota archaeon]|nr:methyltransferase domain-containing protein [Candidatus Bathyarchaeota archaeon]